jgi:hypothetical protein
MKILDYQMSQGRLAIALIGKMLTIIVAFGL